MAGFTAINQSSETATSLREAAEKFRRDVPPSTVNECRKAGVVSAGTPDSTKTMPTHRSSSNAKHLPIKGSQSEAHPTSSDQRVQRGTKPIHFGHSPVSRERGEQSQDQTWNGGSRQSPATAMESQPEHRAARYNDPDSCPSSNSQALNLRKRRIYIENPHADEMLQTPRKKSRKRHTVPPRGKSTAAYVTDTSCASDPQLPLFGEYTIKLGPNANLKRRCQPCREVKILPTIEHQIDPDNPRHSAHPWDDPLVQYLNEDDTSHHCSQISNTCRVSHNVSPTNSDDSFVPSPTALIGESIHGSGGGLRRSLNGKSREDNGGGNAAHDTRRSESFPSPSDATNTTCMLKRECTAALERASSRHVSQNAPTRERSLLLGSRSDFRRAERSALASLGRQLLETRKQVSENQKQTSESQLQMTAILATLKSIAGQANQHWAQQWPASVEGAALVGKTDNTTKPFRTILSPAAADSSEPWIQTPNAFDHRSRKRAASHKKVISIDRNDQYRDKRSRGPFTALSDTRLYPSRPPAGVSSSGSFVVNDHRSGDEFTEPHWSNQHIWESNNPAQDGSNASWGGNLPHERNSSSRTDIPAPSQRPTPHFKATRKRQASMRSPSDMHKNARRPIDHWSPAHTPRSYDSSRIAQGAYRNSFEPRSCQLDIHPQRDKAGIHRPSRSRNPFPHHRTRRREVRHLTNDLRLDEDVASRPYSHRSTDLLLRSAPAPQNQLAEISSSRTQGSSTSVSIDEMVAVGSGTRSADLLSHLVLSTSNQTAGTDDLEGLEQSFSKISKDEQNLGKALEKGNRRSMDEAEVAKFEEKGTQDPPTGKLPGDEDQSHVTTRVMSRKSSELPDIEQVIAEARNSQNHPKNLPVSSMAPIPRARLQSSGSMQTRSQGPPKELGIEARDESTLAQSDIPAKWTLTDAEAPRPSASSAEIRIMEPLSLSYEETDVPGTLQSKSASHIRGPTDRQISTHGPTSSNPRLPSVSKDDCQAHCVPRQQVLSFPNTIEVQIPCRTNTERQFMRPIPSKAREIKIASSRGISRRCRCSCLPDYFRNPPSLIPSLKTWPAGKTEFLAHCQQIADCPAHPDIIRNSCRDILSNERRQRAVHGAVPSQEAPTEMNKRRESILTASDGQQLQRHANTVTSHVLDADGVSDNGDHSKQKAKEALATWPKSGDLTKSPSQRSSRKRPLFRVPPGFPDSPLTERNGDVISDKEKPPKGSRSKSLKHSTNIKSHNSASSLPTPANSSSPARKEADNFQQPTNDHQASHSSQRSSSTLCPLSGQQPDLTDPSGDATLTSLDPNSGNLRNADSASNPNKRPSRAAVHDSDPSTSSKAHKARKHAQRNDSTVTRKQINGAQCPRRHAKLIRRRHATEPPHSPKLMTPVKALKDLSQNPTREPLFPIPNPNTLNQQIPTPPVVGPPNNPPSTARPLWQRTPPPTPPNTRRKTYVPADERKQSKPVLSRHVPPRDREPDEKLLEYGRLKCTYDRHLAAPYAFRWCGKLYHEYRYLVGLRGKGGELLWDEALGRRLGKK